MIIGVGIDLVEMKRVQRALEADHGRRFAERILTPVEREEASRRLGARYVEFVAGRFAAKEAVVKALGCGIGGKVGFQDISVLPDGQGKPVCRLTEEAAKRLALGGTVLIHVSITHTEHQAAAYAVAERRETDSE